MTTDSYPHNLLDRIINQVTFDEGANDHESDEFLREQGISGRLGSEFEYVENEDTGYEFKNINWPTIGEFDETIGAEKIDEFIKKTWDFDDCWLYCIDLIDRTEQEFSVSYTYRVCWSIPTRRKPIPRFTANVYFTYQVSKIRPKDKTVDVQFVFETQQLVHRPGHSRFRQQWLSDILDLKERLIKDCKF